MATDSRQAKQLSCSYGFDINLSTVQIFQQFAAQGQSFFLASGDFGAYSGPVDEPADDPYITVVGGTTLTTDSSSGAWTAETAWLSPASNDGMGDITPEYATGGGVSLVYPIPSWQQGISMNANQGSTTMRNSPDVSMVANNITVFWGNDAFGISFPMPEVGTSFAAPLWAGLIALANEQAADNSQPPVGFANPVLYAIAKSASYQSCFHDITTGMNTNTSSPTKYYAVAGYDLCTGLGTPNGDNLIPALLSPPLDNLLVTPPLGFSSFGPGGGPFTVTSRTYNLTNTGPTPLSWSLVNTSSWLTVSSSSGNLNAGASTTVTISLNPAANGFLIAHPSGNVVINNLTAGTTQNLQFDLYVGNGGFETGGLDDWTLIGSTQLVYALSADTADIAGSEAVTGQPDGQFVRSGLYGAVLGEWASPNLSPVPPAVGSLSQSLATKAGQQFLVSFWLTCVPDENGVTTNNQFTAKWNNAVLYSGNNLPAFGWTNLQFIAPAIAAHTTLEFDFNNDPAAFGLDDVTVEPVPPPVFQPVTINGGAARLTWGSFSGLTYQVQSADNLSYPNWTNVATLTATGILTTATEPFGSTPMQFYRVILLPAP